jgi:hypothetical protein
LFFVAHYNGTAWENFLNHNINNATPASGTGPYTTTISNVSTFSPFTVASNGISPLVVHLLDITATNKGKTNEVNWSSSSEMNGDYFELEKSTDGRNFAKITTVNAKGGNGQYVYADQRAIAGMNYYRLKMADKAGQYFYSKVVNAFVAGSNTFSVDIYPNPVTDQLNIRLMGEMSEEAQVQISDVSGKMVRIFSLSTNESSIDMSGFTPGLYFVKYTDRDHSQLLKVNKQ